jgi:hypothetical protein
VLKSSGTDIGPHAHVLSGSLASAIAYSTWSVADDPASVLSFVQAHLPAGSTVVSTGSGGNPPVQSVIRSWAPIPGVLGVRWLEIQVTSSASGGTVLHAESQSQWIVTRAVSEQIPSGAIAIDVTSAWPGKPPFISRKITGPRKVRALVSLFDSLGVVQPDVINCPALRLKPVVVVTFLVRGSDRPVARASVSSVASFRWPASVPGWSCYEISFSVLGHRRRALVGNAITPLQRLLQIDLKRRQ